jgi:hypothetical protein
MDNLIESVSVPRFAKFQCGENKYCILNIGDIVKVIPDFTNGKYMSHIFLRGENTPIVVVELIHQIWDKLES